MKRLTILFLATIALLPAAVSATTVAPNPARIADAHGARVRDAHLARSAKLKLRQTSVGTILVNGGGLTVFAFTRDSRNHDRCASISGCTSIWPLVTTTARPTLGAGVKRSLVGTIKLADGTRQVTYAGHPLYTYIGSSGPGDTSYVGAHQFGGTWLALSAAGRVVK
jgi:predicted lipoprotein with Yx(FWY)xxD motif